MTFQEITSYCLLKPYAIETYPFDEFTMVIKVIDKIFALLPIDSRGTINLKHPTDTIPAMIERYTGIHPGYHMSKKHWITVDYLQTDVPDELLYSLIDQSYNEVIHSLPKKKQVLLKTTFSVIDYGSIQYNNAVVLRDIVLRKPLGLTFTQEELSKEQTNTIHIVAMYNNDIIGCLLLTPLNDKQIKMRQVAVHDQYQRKGIGSGMVRFAEEIAIENGYEEIILHARLSALPLYHHAHYETIGEIFQEVGIPHIKMRKPV